MEPVDLVVTGRSLHQSALLYRPKNRMRNGRFVPMSAPPQLTRRGTRTGTASASSVRSMRVASAHSAKVCAQPSDWLSVDDVYKLAERTRMRTSLESRHLVLARAQKMVRSDSGMSRPETGWSRGMSRGQWSPDRAASTRRRSAAGGDTGAQTPGDTDWEGGPGFVSNVEISLRPRNPSAGNISVTSNNHHNADNNRLGSALTTATASSYLGSGTPCVSPRPEEPEARKMSVSRQCCEVMGPGVCRDCQRLRVRLKDREKLEADFPRLRISEKNVTTSAIVKRVLPDMTQAEIQDKIARGEIARTGLLFPRRRCHRDNNNDGGDDGDSDDSDKENGVDGLRLNGLHAPQEDGSDVDTDAGSDDTSHGGETFITQPISRPAAGEGEDGGGKGRKKKTSSSSSSSSTPPGGCTTSRTGSGKSVNSMMLLAKLKVKLRGEASTPLFFMDLKHQNSKIFHGRLTKNLKDPPPKDGQPHGGGGGQQRTVSAIPNHLIHPASFVSPRKVKPIKEPAYKVYFQPPLLAKKQQVSNPSFFAGSQDAYSLPERLPDVIQFADGQMSITDPGLAMRPESSMSAVSEEASEGLTHRSEGVKASKEPTQDTVHE